MNNSKISFQTSQPHVLQLKNILVAGIDSEFLEDRLIEEGIVMRKDEKDPILARVEGDPIKRTLQPNASENTVSPSPICCSSLYGYNRENLTKIKILEVIFLDIDVLAGDSARCTAKIGVGLAISRKIGLPWLKY